MESKHTEQIDQIIEIFNSSNSTLKEAVEVIANLLISMGHSYLDDETTKDMQSVEELVDYAMSLRNTNQENIQSALILQGFSMLTWLNGRRS